MTFSSGNVSAVVDIGDCASLFVFEDSHYMEALKGLDMCEANVVGTSAGQIDRENPAKA